MEVINTGNNNKIVFVDSNLNQNSKIHISGDNNTVIIHDTAKLINQTIVIKKNNNHISIGENSKITGFCELIGSGNTLKIGDNTDIGGAKFFIAEQSTVTIGDNCLLSWGLIFRTSDMHSIFDLDSKKRINYSKDIFVGNKVWIAAETWLLKGALISNNSIVGARSTLSKAYNEESVILIGSPAKITKRNVVWDKRYLDEIDDSVIIY